MSETCIDAMDCMPAQSSATDVAAGVKCNRVQNLAITLDKAYHFLKEQACLRYWLGAVMKALQDGEWVRSILFNLHMVFDLHEKAPA